MKLLVITQAVDLDDPDLGFFHRWLELFSEKTQLTVICLRRGRTNLPASVRILSLGKEKTNFLIFKKIKYLYRFFKYIFKYRRDYDSVLVHMNPEYVVLGGLLWRLWGKKIALWYVHKKVDLKLRLAEKLTHLIFTASLESFRLLSPKVLILGHGIDVERFKLPVSLSPSPLKLLSVGRISQTKDLMTPIKSLQEFLRQGQLATLDFVGAPVWPEDRKYLNEIENYVRQNQLQQTVKFLGGFTYEKMPQVYQSHHLLIHASQTGSLDKVVLEALASGLQVFTSSEGYGELKNLVHRFDPGDWRQLTEKIKEISNKVEPNLVGAEYVKEKANLTGLIFKIVGHLNTP